MKITIKNIGPVKESTIDLDKNLIVLCGGNNTGKTYVAYTVYNFCSSANNIYNEISILNKRVDHIENLS
jgi:predicted ATPase